MRTLRTLYCSMDCLQVFIWWNSSRSQRRRCRVHCISYRVYVLSCSTSRIIQYVMWWSMPRRGSLSKEQPFDWLSATDGVNPRPSRTLRQTIMAKSSIVLRITSSLTVRLPLPRPIAIVLNRTVTDAILIMSVSITRCIPTCLQTVASIVQDRPFLCLPSFGRKCLNSTIRLLPTIRFAWNCAMPMASLWQNRQL